jgi:hypothetical protein
LQRGATSVRVAVVVGVMSAFITMSDRRLEGGIGRADTAAPHDDGTEPSAERELRAKYIDWCSARVAERFLQLSPDDIYELAERSPDAPVDGAPELVRGTLPDTGSDTFRALIERVTEVLAVELSLPPFEQWAEAYRTSPQQFDAELLGLWRERL